MISQTDFHPPKKSGLSGIHLYTDPYVSFTKSMVKDPVGDSKC